MILGLDDGDVRIDHRRCRLGGGGGSRRLSARVFQHVLARPGADIGAETCGRGTDVADRHQGPHTAACLGPIGVPSLLPVSPFSGWAPDALLLIMGAMAMGSAAAVTGPATAPRSIAAPAADATLATLFTRMRSALAGRRTLPDPAGLRQDQAE